MKNSAKSTKSRQAYLKLREMIIEGKFSQTNTWSLRKLGKRLRMSVVPVTEAIRRLEQEGIVDVRPQRGIVIRELSSAELEELTLIREAIEVQAVRLLAIYKPEGKIRKLHQKAIKLRKLLEEQKYEQAAIVDFKFHQDIVNAAGSSSLTKQYDRLSVLFIINTEGLRTKWFHMESWLLTNHLDLVKAIESGDPEKADREIRNHIKSAADG